MRTSKGRKERAETCGTPATQSEMRRAQLVLSQMDNNFWLAQVLSRFLILSV